VTDAGPCSPPFHAVWVVVLNYRGWDDTRQCLASLQPAMARGATIVLIDNGGEDAVAAAMGQEFPGVEVIVSRVNGGFSAGNNLGIDRALAAGARKVLILNNDMVVVDGLFERLLAPDVAAFGIVGPGVAYMDEPKVRMPTAFRFCPSGQEAIFDPVEPVGDGVEPVDVVMGCAMWIDAAVLRDVGRFHEPYFLQHEESDYCLMASARGWRIGALGTLLARHKGGSSFKREGVALLHFYNARNLFLLARRLRGFHGQRGRVARLVARALPYVRYHYLVASRDGREADAAAWAAGVWAGLIGRFGWAASHASVGGTLIGRSFERLGPCWAAVERMIARQDKWDGPRVDGEGQRV
jgi:GT2 family glycosyltransferase